MSKLEKLYSIIENSRDVGVKLPKGVLQQVESAKTNAPQRLVASGSKIPVGTSGH